MKAITCLFLFALTTVYANAQDEKKVPEKKLISANSSATLTGKTPEKKLVDHSTAKKEKVNKITGTPEKKLVSK